ncbi:MAG: hypothetical protein OXE78_05120 [Gammaproteobacteria bacterium]|nr:hypothetical protein [Gammaproteobacteria bacterium]
MIMSVFCLGLLSGCETSTVPKFEHMTLEELAEYNKSRNLAQMIVCSDENRSFSRVRRRRCMTVEAMYGSDVQLSQLQLLNNIPGLGTGE